MCGIVGAVADRDVTPILLEGLQRLEYRGYDSAGVAVLDQGGFQRRRVRGKVNELAQSVSRSPLRGNTGIAHTRWATHGRPSVDNAHPHICKDGVALAHNGIIENHEALRAQQREAGYEFVSETDTEVVVNQIHRHLEEGSDLLAAVQTAARELEGTYALGVLDRDCPERLVAARKGSPLVIGLGDEGRFIASDIFALLPVAQRFVVLEEGDVADLGRKRVAIFDAEGKPVNRPVIASNMPADGADKSGYRHYMLKEIFTQPPALADTLAGRVENGQLLETGLAAPVAEVLEQARHVHIIACGSSYHAGLVAKHWLETLARIQCSVDIASEYRYRDTVVPDATLFVAISQSGETLDVLEALRLAKTKPYLANLAVCNMTESSLAREADAVFLTRAGIEIGVAATKTFTAQLLALALLTLLFARRRGLNKEQEAWFAGQLEKLPGRVNSVLQLDGRIKKLAEDFIHKHHALFLGRGAMLPVAMEGALKLKEISYIHAEAYAAGELKHGPLALIDDDMPVIAVAPNNGLLGKLNSNLREVSARGARLYVFSDSGVDIEAGADLTVISVPPVEDLAAPVVYTVPLQLLAYHVAVLKGSDVDQPRNLAKSVTVE